MTHPGQKEAIRVLDHKESQILDSHFVHAYGSFYDILFVDHQGFVFHSIKQESDHHSNLLTGVLAETSLAKQLKGDPTVEFVDFEPYGPSGEAAAFFVIPVLSDGKANGWFILQYGSNELNAMLVKGNDLGRSGEVYLVNQKRLMLSDSRFINKKAILSVAADTEPVRQAFQVGAGHSLTRDYRNVDVFSSFTAVDVLGVTWAIIVEIDADEILGEYYLENKQDLLDPLIEAAKINSASLSVKGALHEPLQSDARVDVNEWRRVDNGETSWTAGVGPCTALVAYSPGEFSYLLHLGPTDDVYIDDPMTRMFLGTKRTDLLRKLLNRIARFDIVLNDLPQLRFVVTITHTNSIEGILDMLLTQGIDLSQIKIAYNPAADFANVHFNQETDDVRVQWVYLSDYSTLFTDAAELSSVSELLNVFSN